MSTIDGKVVSVAAKRPTRISDYVAVARPDHWFKNIFMLPGIGMALLLAPRPLAEIALPVCLAVVATCLTASANYVINEWLDAETDRHHATKKYRPTVVADMRVEVIYTEYALLAGLGLTVAHAVSVPFFALSGLLLVMGILYNVRPFRTKERPYLDVLSEAINNPIRFMLGWVAVAPQVLPPSSILLAYWMGGAFLMGVKRYAEYRFLNDPVQAGLYRRSFRFYTEKSLLMSSFFYAQSSAFFLGIFLIKYRIEYLLSFPLFALLFTWYMYLGMKPDSAAQRPESLYRERPFVAFAATLALVLIALTMVDLPWLRVLLDTTLVNW